MSIIVFSDMPIITHQGSDDLLINDTPPRKLHTSSITPGNITDEE
jgi:hypothetical protein